MDLSLNYKKKSLILLNSRNSQVKKKTDSAYLKPINLMKSNLKIRSILLNYNLLC